MAVFFFFFDGFSSKPLQDSTAELDFSQTPVVPSGSVAAIIARTVGPSSRESDAAKMGVSWLYMFKKSNK